MSRLHPAPHRGLPNGQGLQRGFTLIELSVVILIITVFAGLSIPTIVNQMRDRRVQQAAREIALMYRQARLRAIGRGSAVLVRFNGTSYTVREARLGASAPSAQCGDLPASSCLNTRWDSVPAESRLVDGYAAATSGETANTVFGISDSAGATVSALEVCFTPMGRAFSRPAVIDTVTFAPMDQAYLASVSRPGLTRTRRVVLMPNGTARLSAE
jgi:prepilin-type N-terminal cleavage/methylation domain-containing protein